MKMIETAPMTAPLIYVVDDEPHVAELYTAILESENYRVSVFNDRWLALEALKAARSKPKLLITDYHGISMHVDLFMHQCLQIHPALRILMISGFDHTEVRLSRARPDRFIQKPFRLEEFELGVRAALRH